MSRAPGLRPSPSTHLVVLVLSLVGVGACQGEDEAPDPVPSVALATSVPTLGNYCEVQGLRRMIADGDLSRSQLPSFTDRTEVEGTPRILDFTVQRTESSAAFLGRLYASPGLKDVRVDRTEVETCMETTTDADVERQQGGPGFLADR